MVHPPAPRAAAAAAVASSFLFQSEARSEEGREGGRGEIALLSLSFGERDGQKTKREKSGLDKKKEGGETREGFYDEAASAILRHGSGMARQAGKQHKRSQISFSLTRHDSIITGGAAAGAGGGGERGMPRRTSGKSASHATIPSRSLVNVS